MRILTLDNGEFQVFSLPHGKFDMVFKTSRGTFKQLQAENEEVLDRCIKIWTYARHIEHKLDK